MVNNYTIVGELWKSTPRYIWTTSTMCWMISSLVRFVAQEPTTYTT
jgi:hypothetical protein